MSGPTAASVARARRGGSGPEGRPSGTEQTGCTEQTAAGRAPPWGQSLCLAYSVAPPATGSPWPDAQGSSVTSLSLPCRPSGPGLLSCPRVCLLLAEPPPCRPPQGGPCSSPTLDSASSLPSRSSRGRHSSWGALAGGCCPPLFPWLRLCGWVSFGVSEEDTVLGGRAPLFQEDLLSHPSRGLSSVPVCFFHKHQS